VRESSRDADSSALPSWRGLAFGVLALAAASLLAAWVLSHRLERGDRPPTPVTAASDVKSPPSAPPPPLEPPPPPLEPTAPWRPVAAIVGDGHATSALILAFDSRWAEADRHVRAMAQWPTHGDVRAARAGNETGLARLRAGDAPAAVRAFEAASRADAGDVEVVNNLGYAYLQAGRAREGVASLSQALRLSPTRSSAWINLAEGFAALGHDDASVAALGLALRYSANREQTRDFLRDAAQGHASPAFRKQVARALERGPSVPASPLLR
jgi:hypothetical protein